MAERSMKQSVAKLSKFLLEQQLPDTKGVINKDPQAPASTLTDFMPIVAKDHVTQVALETCQCIHLQEYLPHLLDLDVCKAKNHPRGWVVANPVHALHLESQLEDSLPVSTHWKQPPLLYGEEQQRTLALSTEGVVEDWCPLDGRSAIIHDDTAIEKKEPVVPHHLHSPRHPRKPPHPVTANSGGTTAPASPHIPPASPQIKPLPSPAASSSASLSRPMGPPTVGSTSLPAPVTMPMLSPQEVKSSTTSTEAPIQQQPPPPQPHLPPRPPLVPEGSLSSHISISSSSATNKPPPSLTSSTPAATTTLENVASAPPFSTVQSAAMSIHAPNATSTTLNDNPLAPPAHLLPDHRYHHLRLEEDRIRLIRRSLSSQRFKKKAANTKKRKRESDFYKTPGLPGWRPSTTKEYTTQQQEDWSDAAITVRSKVELWMENFRVSRQSLLEERVQSATGTGTGIASSPQPSQTPSFFLPQEPVHTMRCCQLCANQKSRRDKTNGHDNGDEKEPKKKKSRAPLVGDELMQCLECSFIGCAPQSTAPKSKQHILRHLLLSGHTFGKYHGLSNLSCLLVDCPFAHITYISIASLSRLLWRTRPTILLQMRRLRRSSHF
jgi:hypothetical protein